MPTFTHLHCHSYFSLLDGAASPQELCRRAAEVGMSAVALTDHNTLAGAVRFFQAAREVSLKPIIGVEFTVERVEGPDTSAAKRRPPRSPAPTCPGFHEPRADTTVDYSRYAHLVLLAEDDEGYANLCRLVTCARLGQAQYLGPFSPEFSRVDRKKPVLTREHLQQHASHLICLSGCEKGEIPQLLAAGWWREAEAVAEHYRALFGRESFFLEVQNHLLPHPQRLLRYKLQSLGEQLEIPLVATNNVHHADRAQARAQDLLVCIRALQPVHQYHPDRKLNAEYSLKPPQEMEALFTDQPQAVRNAQELAERCQWTLDLEHFHFPKFDLRSLGKLDAADRQPQRPGGHPPTLPVRNAGSPAWIPSAQDDRWPLPQPGEDTEGFLRRLCEARAEEVYGRANGGRARKGAPTAGPDVRDENRDGAGQSPHGTQGCGSGRTKQASCAMPATDVDVRLNGKRRRESKFAPTVDERVRERLAHELQIIGEQGLCDYFLIVWDICRFARSRGIMTTGRGSAGDSVVSYLLDITSADPLAHDLLFERFLNPQRRQMPDIDVDFDARRRDEVIAYVYRRYGADRVAAVCTVNTFRARSAVREVGKALGMDEGELGVLAQTLPHIHASEITAARERFPEVRDAKLDFSDKTLLLELCEQISGFPRHLSVHVGGLVIGSQPLTDVISLALAEKGIVIAEFDKDDIEALGLVKMDLLGLRTHTALSDCLELIQRRTGERLDLERLFLDDEPTFELLRSTQTVGCFQLESPGQRNLLGRAQPREFEEIIANISLFRPGPVQSDMIKPYLRRKHGLEEVTYPHPALEPIVRRTFGVVIYQEQVLEIAAAVAGFSLGEADKLRRLMTSDRSQEEMMALGGTFIEKAVARGVEQVVAEEVFRQIAGFAAYGFNKAHAACFAKISYQTAWLKAHYPAELLAGIMSAQPMGFYPPRTIAEEAKRLGLQMLPPCVNRSRTHFTVEGEVGSQAIRCGLLHLLGMSEAAVQSILAARQEGLLQNSPAWAPGVAPCATGPGASAPERAVGARHMRTKRASCASDTRQPFMQLPQEHPFRSLRDFCRRTSVPRPQVERLILARAFEFTGQSPTELLWELSGPGGRSELRPPRQHTMAELDLEETELSGPGGLPPCPPESARDRVRLDLHLLGFSTGPHPLAPWRQSLARRGVIPSTGLYQYSDGDRVKVAGIVVARARPPTKSGRTAIFICLEDEWGLVDVAVFEEAYQRHGRELLSSPVLVVEGKLSRMGKLDLSVVVQRVEALGRADAAGAEADGGKRPRGEKEAGGDVAASVL